ncbi:hypothetical protein HYH02_012243 [Chlamydomonas schloesseri]|uniref:Uncharacterized protein n=1 Tax=Chlamydomonas schloesseri TaxID=2026947 RepID=A0A835W2F1_9CHLO|nr:hypothetical protein HYH02_012243 [Chlamydomonas schloesseri]|eukprot:KAG2434579.1 hypothetical protein HYH02_012243 [Chlamydomonas schloesseri]
MLANVFLFVKWGKGAARWENFWIMAIAFTFYCFYNPEPYTSPQMVFLSTGNFVVVGRYVQWLMATPAISSLVANMTGRPRDYTLRDMFLVLTDVWAVACFIVCCLSTSFWIKITFYVLALVFFLIVFVFAGKSFGELINNDCPTETSRTTAKIVVVVYFVGQNVHTLFSTIGPEVGGFINALQAEIGATFGDLTAKVLFCSVATVLNFQVFMYHKRQAEEQQAEGGSELNAPTKGVLAPLDDGGQAEDAKEAKMTTKPTLQSGIVILAVPDLSMMPYFRAAFKALPANIELVPAIGPANTLMLTERAAQSGHLDCVLVHPALLHESTFDRPNLATRIKMLGQRVCAFGFDGSEGPGVGWMLDGWFDGPSGDEAVDQENLLHLLVVMQSLQKFKYSSTLAAAANAHPLPAPPLAPAPPQPQYAQQQPQQQYMQQPSPYAPQQPSPYAPQQQPPSLATTSMRMTAGGMPSFANNNGTNPLYEPAPSPGQSLGGGYGAPMSPLATSASMRVDRYSPQPQPMAIPQQQAAAPMQQVDAAVMQQLLTEIVRLQAELGENK